MKNWFTLLFLLSSFWAFAQKEQVVSLKDIRGEFAITENMNITISEAKEQAREQAKRKAIEQVCGQKINIWDKIELSAAGETYNSLSVVQTDGEIIEFTITKEWNEQSNIRSNELIFYCVANVKIKKGVSSDPNFSAKVDGIRSIYFENDILTFSIQPLQNCYVNIFLFENQEKGFLLYPDTNEKNTELIANQQYTFPLNNAIEWYITMESQQKETNQLVFVFTKKQMNFFRDETSRSEIEKWMMKIPADQKYIYVSAFDIRKK